MSTSNILLAEVAENYKALIEPTRVRFQNPINREIDLRTMSLADAELITKYHPDILLKKEKPKSKKEQAESTE